MTRGANTRRSLPAPGEQARARGAAIADYNYTEDAVGNVTAIADAVMPGYSRTFGYDDLNRLTQANTGALLWRTGSYTYDAMGNMIDRALGGLVVPSSPSDPDSCAVTPARVTHLDYSGPRVSAVTENGLLRSVTYDAHGNETSYIATRTYMPRHNLLWKIEDDGEGVDHHVVTYQYDGRGLRVVRTETPVADPNGWAAQRTFVYSPELQLLSVTADDRPNLWGKRAVTNDVFIPRYDLVYFAGQPVAQIDGATGAVRYTFTDHLGTPLLQTSATAAVIWQAEYEPFGNVWQMRAGSFAEQPLRFPGQDVATTWEGSEENYNIHRWYRSGWGRYTQADPLSPIMSDPNQFSYVGNDPVRFLDPTGLVRIRHTFTDRAFDWGLGGDQGLPYGRASATGRCSGCANEWHMELSLTFDHGYRCAFPYQCRQERTHANIESAFVSRAAETFARYEHNTYPSRQYCEQFANELARELANYVLNPFLWDASLRLDFVRAQMDYESTHHGWCAPGWQCSD